jgi:hypothetical protein
MYCTAEKSGAATRLLYTDSGTLPPYANRKFNKSPPPANSSIRNTKPPSCKNENEEYERMSNNMEEHVRRGERAG